MLTFMLCGAGDTDRVLDDFLEVSRGFGAEGLHFSSGRIRHLNALTNTWEDNSRRSVADSHLCVFAVVERFGEITWMTEFREAIRTGTPFLVLCLRETLGAYRRLVQGSGDEAPPTVDRRTLEQLSKIEAERVTLVEFVDGEFADALRPQIASLLSRSLLVLAERTRRAALSTLMARPAEMGVTELEVIRELALDETEEKRLRKQAITALADRRDGIDLDTLASLLGSMEQGVQRTTLVRIPDLYVERPPSAEFFDLCVSIADDADDVGVARRMVATLLDIDLAAGIEALSRLNLSDVGLRRRIGEALVRSQSELVGSGLRGAAAALAERCIGEKESSGWKPAVEDLIVWLKAPAP